MESNMRQALVLSLTLALFGGSPAAAEFTIDWRTIDGGGAMLTTGGDFELTGGFWPVTVEEAFCFGDLDADGDVDLADLAGLLAVYGTTCD